MMIPVNRKAITYGILSYPLLYAAYVVFLNLVAQDDSTTPAEWLVLAINILSWLGLLLPGYITGRMAQYKGILHGFITGIVAGGVSAMGFSVLLGDYWLGESPWLNITYYISYIVFMASVGGGIGQLHSKYALRA